MRDGTNSGTTWVSPLLACRTVRWASRTTERLTTAVLDAIYPRCCTSCGSDIATTAGHLCWDCRADFQIISMPFCSHCGDPVEGAVTHDVICSWCRRRRPHFKRARSAVRFRGGVRAALHKFKYGNGFHLRSDLGEYLAACVAVHFSDVRLDGVTCVPLHAVRERQRTYNQSALLARELSSRVRLPCDPRLLVRTRPTATQTNLTASERRDNVRNAFCVRDPDWAQGRRWLLVDDVMTTGATVDEASRALMAVGAASVHVVTVARG